MASAAHVPVGGADGQDPRLQGDWDLRQGQGRHRQGHGAMNHPVRRGAGHGLRGLHVGRRRREGSGDHGRRGLQGGDRRHRQGDARHVPRVARAAGHLRVLRQRVRRGAGLPAAAPHRQVELHVPAEAAGTTRGTARSSSTARTRSRAGSRAASSVSVDTSFPLDQAAEGHKYLESGASTGKVLYRITTSRAGGRGSANVAPTSS